MVAFRVELPWPPKELSPNSRLGWRRAHKAKRSYRQTCWAETLLCTGGQHWLDWIPEWLLTLSFHPPDRRKYDDDNLVARMKSGLDGLADALGVDDSRFRLAAPEILAPVPDGRVVVRLEAQERKEA